MIIQSIVDIAEICYQKGVRYAVISPGSRSAHLTISFARHPHLEKIVIPDERSAAYVALGLAQQSRSLVALICTSGTAALNFYPAIAESYYQNVPLLILTADRPAEWIDKNDGQTIRQNHLYQNHIKSSYTFPQSFEDDGSKHLSVFMTNEAINIAKKLPMGPVHINVPIKEPFYPLENEKIGYSKNILIIDEVEKPLEDVNRLQALFETLKDKKVAMVAGQREYDSEATALIDELAEKKNLPVFTDIISNAFQAQHSLKSHDTFIHPKLPNPDVLITFGQSIISKKLKLFLRKNPGLEHWHIAENDYPADTFLSLNRVIHTTANHFLKAFLNHPFTGNKTFYETYKKADHKAAKTLYNFINNAEFGEFKAVNMILDCMPENGILHLANSMPVRYANIIGLRKNTEVFANRGTSGIDGCISTAVGHCLSSEKMNVVITGDMAFFYDRNALWHNYRLPNLRIIILNNHGGGIFRLIDGPSAQPELEKYFETNQKLNARNTASDFGMDYYLCNSEKELNSALFSFFQPSEKGKILEIETDKIINQKVYSTYKSLTEYGT